MLLSAMCLSRMSRTDPRLLVNVYWNVMQLSLCEEDDSARLGIGVDVGPDRASFVIAPRMLTFSINMLF